MTDLFIQHFGLSRNDIDIDFDQPSRPHLVTQILQRCLISSNKAEPDPNAIWELTVGKRIEYLLGITAAGGKTSSFTETFPCRNPECQQQIEVELSFVALTNLQHEADDSEHLSIQVGEEELVFRRPTGTDQRNWQQEQFNDEKTGLGAIIRTLLVQPAMFKDNGLSIEENIQIIDEAMQEFDPLVNFHVTADCPYCEAQRSYEIDLQETALRCLRQAQRLLVRDVHRLALHYHWSEEQILSMPVWRRQHYLALIEGERDL